MPDWIRGMKYVGGTTVGVGIRLGNWQMFVPQVHIVALPKCHHSWRRALLPQWCLVCGWQAMILHLKDLMTSRLISELLKGNADLYCKNKNILILKYYEKDHERRRVGTLRKILHSWPRTCTPDQELWLEKFSKAAIRLHQAWIASFTLRWCLSWSASFPCSFDPFFSNVLLTGWSLAALCKMWAWGKPLKMYAKLWDTSEHHLHHLSKIAWARFELADRSMLRNKICCCSSTSVTPSQRWCRADKLWKAGIATVSSRSLPQMYKLLYTIVRAYSYWPLLQRARCWLMAVARCAQCELL